MSEKRVNLLIIGAARSATTSMCRILSKHPTVCFCSVKEPQFFSEADWNDRLDTYHELFKCDDLMIYAEGSTNYSKFPHFNLNIHRDIYEYNPAMKFIYMMRDPVERIISHYNFARERGYANRGINEEIMNNPIYVDSSKYHLQIAGYLDHFSIEQFNFILLEEFKQDIDRCLSSVYDFLGIEWQDYNIKDAHSNKSNAGRIGHIKYDNPRSLGDYIMKGINYISRRINFTTKASFQDLNSDCLQYLSKELLPDINALEGLLHKDLSSWRSSLTP